MYTCVHMYIYIYIYTHTYTSLGAGAQRAGRLMAVGLPYIVQYSSVFPVAR